MAAELTRDEEIRQIMTKDYPGAYRITFALMLLGVGILIGAALFGGDGGYTVNLYTEVLSIGVTVFILDYLNRRRDERNADEALKDQLITNVRSGIRDIADHAIHQMRDKGWLTGENGLLQGIWLWGGNMQGCKLQAANMQFARLWNVDFHGVDLTLADLSNASSNHSNFSYAVLTRANLHNAVINDSFFEYANLQDVNFQKCHLSNANLRWADLSGADLRGANLIQAELYQAKLQERVFWGDPKEAIFDETTILPDGTHWSPGRDMREFTHPDEWAREHNRPE